MRCKTCDYPLWNLTAQKCPECGSPFKPSEFQFVLNSVRFCCPQCDQAYYGTGPTGHLVPRQFTCVSCGSPLDMDEMVLRPAEGVQEQQTRPESVPWLERKRIGFLKAWWQTVWMSMVNPKSLMRGAPVDANLGDAWGFAIVTNALAICGGASLPLLLFSFIEVASSGGRAGGLGMLATAGAILVIWPLMAAAWVGLWGLVCHGLLKMTGETASSMGRTYQALCYSAGPMALMVVPCLGPYCGQYVSSIWWLVLAVIMVHQAQCVSGGRAALATLVFPVGAVVVMITAYMVFVAAMIATAGAMGPGTPAPVSVVEYNAQTIVSTLNDHATRHGQWPDHAIRIITPGSLVREDQFVLPFSNTDGQLVPVGGATLRGLPFLSQQQRDRAVQEAVDALPDDVIAYRLGDFVFTHPGIDLKGDTSGLWMAVMCYDPEQNSTTTPQDPIVLGFVDGTTQQISRGELPMQLYTQNVLRAQHGLPPLPDPATVTHSTPARER